MSFKRNIEFTFCMILPLLLTHTGKFVFCAPKILRRNFRQNISRQKSLSS
jgi:hypothetical protein